ncbi:MAG: hypothetical protein IJY46_10385 [Lentisphaeria bacterium]|nr:hypothetical protein [Lentisphaeria bacterium]
MPQGELWKATPRDILRAEAFKQTAWGKKKDQEYHDLAMQSLNIRVKRGYIPTDEEVKALEEWRREKAQQEDSSAE